MEKEPIATHIPWEIFLSMFERLDFPDIQNFCLSYTGFSDICAMPEVKILILQKKREYVTEKYKDDFWNAFHTEGYDELYRLIDMGVDPDVPDIRGNSITRYIANPELNEAFSPKDEDVYYNIWRSQKEIAEYIEYLAKNGADIDRIFPDEGDFPGDTLLEIAIGTDNPVLVEKLLDLGADPNLSVRGTTPLGFFLFIEDDMTIEQKQIFELLVRGGANIVEMGMRKRSLREFIDIEKEDKYGDNEDYWNSALQDFQIILEKIQS